MHLLRRDTIFQGALKDSYVWRFLVIMANIMHSEISMHPSIVRKAVHRHIKMKSYGLSYVDEVILDE